MFIMRKFQVGLILTLCLMLMTSPVIAGGTTIELNGNIAPATIDAGVDKADLVFDMETRITSAADTVTATSTSLIPVKISVGSITHKAGSWSPEMITGNVNELAVTEAQGQAKLTVNTLGGANATTPSYTKVAPTGETTLSLNTSSDGITWTPASGNVELGVIKDTNGIAGNEATIDVQLEASNKRILSKIFQADMVLNFEAVEE